MAHAAMTRLSLLFGHPRYPKSLVSTFDWSLRSRNLEKGMATISALSTSLYSSIPHRGVVPRSFRPLPRLLSLSFSPLPSPLIRRSLFLLPSKPFPASWRSRKAVAEGEAAASEEEPTAEAVAAAATTAEEEDATVAVAVSPSDMLTMFFQVPPFSISFFCLCPKNSVFAGVSYGFGVRIWRPKEQWMSRRFLAWARL